MAYLDDVTVSSDDQTFALLASTQPGQDNEAAVCPGCFYTYNVLGAPSTDGQYYLFTTDWDGKLGSTSGETSCNPASDCRGDVFLARLPFLTSSKRKSIDKGVRQ